MGFAVLHIEKGTAGKAGGLGSHIDRTKKVLNADPKLSEKIYSTIWARMGKSMSMTTSRTEGHCRKESTGAYRRATKERPPSARMPLPT